MTDTEILDGLQEMVRQDNVILSEWKDEYAVGRTSFDMGKGSSLRDALEKAMAERRRQRTRIFTA